MFITRQLKGLEDTKSAQFNRYFYLLEVRHRLSVSFSFIHSESRIGSATLWLQDICRYLSLENKSTITFCQFSLKTLSSRVAA